MRRLTGKHDQVLSDLRSMLEAGLDSGETWPETVDYAMNETWDRLTAALPESTDERNDQ